MKKYKITIQKNYTGWKEKYYFSAEKMTANKYSITFYNADHAGEIYKKWTFYKHPSLKNAGYIVKVEKL